MLPAEGVPRELGGRLGKLRSSGPTRHLNRVLNYWMLIRSVGMLRRKASLAGTRRDPDASRYSTRIGNLRIVETG